MCYNKLVEGKMLTKGSIIKIGTDKYVLIGIQYVQDLTIKRLLDFVHVTILEQTVEWFLYTGINVIAVEYTKDFLEKDIKIAHRGLNRVQEIGKVDEKEFNLWLQKVELLHPRYIKREFARVESIENVVKNRLKNKDLYENFIDFCNVEKNLSDEKAKRIHKGKIYYYRIDEYVFYALALGKKKFLNLGTDVTRISYYLENKDYVTLEDYELYKTGITCTFYSDLYKEVNYDE